MENREGLQLRLSANHLAVANKEADDFAMFLQIYWSLICNYI